MKIRWLFLAAALAVAMTALAWLPTRSSSPMEPQAGTSAAPRGVEREGGCPADAKVAKLDQTLKGMYARDVALASFKGKVVLLNFWATWCGPCKAEIPGLVDLQERYKKQGLEVLGISVSDEMSLLEPFAKEFKINYPLLVGLGHEDLLQHYGATAAIPVTVIVSRDGKMCYRKLGLADLEQVEREIKALL